MAGEDQRSEQAKGEMESVDNTGEVLQTLRKLKNGQELGEK